MTTLALDWSYRTTEIPETGLRETRNATPDECVALAMELEILSCEDLAANFTIRATGKGHYRLAGKLKGRVTQPCVVTLEPVSERVEGEVDVEYWPPASRSRVRRRSRRSRRLRSSPSSMAASTRAGSCSRPWPPALIPIRASPVPSSRAAIPSCPPRRPEALSMP